MTLLASGDSCAVAQPLTASPTVRTQDVVRMATPFCE